MSQDWLVPVFFLALGALVLWTILLVGQALDKRRQSRRAALPTTHSLDSTLQGVEQPKTGPENRLPEHLTARELEIARLAVEGKRNAEIARELHLSIYTIENHLKRIYSKLHIRSRTELAKLWRESGK